MDSLNFSVRIGDGATGITGTAFTRQQLDDLKEMYGPSRSQIVLAAIAALHQVIGADDTQSPDEQLTDLMRVYRAGKSEIVRYALFWLWLQWKISQDVLAQYGLAAANSVIKRG